MPARVGGAGLAPGALAAWAEAVAGTAAKARATRVSSVCSPNSGARSTATGSSSNCAGLVTSCTASPLAAVMLGITGVAAFSVSGGTRAAVLSGGAAGLALVNAAGSHVE